MPPVVETGLSKMLLYAKLRLKQQQRTILQRKNLVYGLPYFKKGADAYKYKLSKVESGLRVVQTWSTPWVYNVHLHTPLRSLLPLRRMTSAVVTLLLYRDGRILHSLGESLGEVKSVSIVISALYTPLGKPVVKCPGNGDYKLVLVVDQFNIMLTDEEYKCDRIKVTIHRSMVVMDYHFLFIGADQDKPMKASLFKHIKIEQTEWDAKGRDLGSVLIKDKLTAKSSDTWQVDGKSQRLYVFAPDGLKVGQMGDVAETTSLCAP